MLQEPSWLTDFALLPPEKQAEVVDFVQFLRQKHVSAAVQQTVHPLAAFAGALADTDLEPPQDNLPEPPPAAE